MNRILRLNRQLLWILTLALVLVAIGNQHRHALLSQPGFVQSAVR